MRQPAGTPARHHLDRKDVPPPQTATTTGKTHPIEYETINQAAFTAAQTQCHRWAGQTHEYNDAAMLGLDM